MGKLWIVWAGEKKHGEQDGGRSEGRDGIHPPGRCQPAAMGLEGGCLSWVGEGLEGERGQVPRMEAWSIGFFFLRHNYLSVAEVLC